MQVVAKACAGDSAAQLVVDIMWQTEPENQKLLLRALPVLADSWLRYKRRHAELSMPVQAGIQKLHSCCRLLVPESATHMFYDFLDQLCESFNAQAERALHKLVATSADDAGATAEPDEHPHVPSYPLPTWYSLLRSPLAAQIDGQRASEARMTEMTPIHDSDTDVTENFTTRGTEYPHQLASKIIYRGLMRVVPCMSPFLLSPVLFGVIRC